jgi:hypothetical protein
MQFEPAWAWLAVVFESTLYSVASNSTALFSVLKVVVSTGFGASTATLVSSVEWATIRVGLSTEQEFVLRKCGVEESVVYWKQRFSEFPFLFASSPVPDRRSLLCESFAFTREYLLCATLARCYSWRITTGHQVSAVSEYFLCGLQFCVCAVSPHRQGLPFYVSLVIQNLSTPSVLSIFEVRDSFSN